MGSIDLAINKAVTARMFDGPASQAQSGKPSFGIQESDAGKVVVFDAGIPSPLAATSLAPLRRAPRRLSRTFQLRTQPQPRFGTQQPPSDHQGLRFAGRLWMVLSRRND